MSKDVNLDAPAMKKILAELRKRQASFGDRFYYNLFKLSPKIEKLFESVGMAMQGRMILQAIGIALEIIDRPEDLKVIFRGLGKRHVLYDVSPEYYDLIPKAFLLTAKDLLGDQIGEDQERDWGTLFGLVIAFMKEGDELARKRTVSKNIYSKNVKNLNDPYLARFLKTPAKLEKDVEVLSPDKIDKLVEINYIGEKTVKTCPMRTILEVSHSNKIPHICECGGMARCSTCRVMIVDGLENCLPRSSLEEKLAIKKGLPPEIRLACQTRVTGNVMLKRLVKDENDIVMALAGASGSLGEEIQGAILFTDIWGFTKFAETQLPYDVIHALNRLFQEMGQIVDENDGFIDKYIGDNLMAIYGLGGESPAEVCRKAASSAFQILANMEHVNQYLRTYLGAEFRLGIGVAFGTMVVGEVGFSLKKQFTAIGDTVNIAARLESETRKQQVDLLVSESLKENLTEDFYQVGKTFNCDFKGKSEKIKAFEILPKTRNLNLKNLGKIEDE